MGQVFQKILAVVILLLIPLFLLKEYKAISASRELFSYRDGEVVTNEYSTKEDKSFVIIIFSAEGDGYCEKNLTSIFSQSYPHFRVVYLGNHENITKAKEHLENKQGEEKITFMESTQADKTFDIFYKVIHECKDEEVIIHLNGTDWLANDNILEKLNKTYRDPDVWLTYGDYMKYPSLKKQELEPVVNRTLRDFKADKTPWMHSHLKTYYAGLLKQLTPSLEGLSEKALSREDKMLMLSLLKIGKWHVRFIPEVLSIHQEEAISR
jgi:hypothetical protein